MALLYIAAEAMELKSLASRLTGLRPLKWPLQYAQEGILEGRRILLAAHGTGPKWASHALEIAIRAISAADLQSSRLEAVISTGFCGGLAPELEAGQIVVASDVRSSADESFPACSVDSERPYVIGTILSQDQVAGTAAEKARLRDRFGALAVEMEAFGIAARAKRAGLPFCCIKVVTDKADESFGIDLNKSRSADGRISRGKIVFQAVSKPAAIPELFRLKRRAELAAGALGDFLVSCRLNIEPAGSTVEADKSSNGA